jgi:hypothetical protein
VRAFCRRQPSTVALALDQVAQDHATNHERAPGVSNLYAL